MEMPIPMGDQYSTTIILEEVNVKPEPLLSSLLFFNKLGQEKIIYVTILYAKGITPRREQAK